ncbi:MAG: metallophosphoesterase [Phycisphaerae bacterium]|nr:metallophosphoesterase [Phycisphaerae bacterium]
MKRCFLTIVVLVSLVPAALCQTSGEFRSDVKGPPYPWTNLNFPDDTGALRFVILSDRTGGHREGVFARGVQAANLMAPDLVMCVGDLIEGYTEDLSILNQQADEFDGLVAKLQAPFFYVVGNHDISNSVQKKWYPKRRGRPYYHFVYKNVLFLALCTEDPPSGNISKEQVAYVQQALASNPKVRWTFVFLHQPLFVTTKKPHPDWEQIETLLADRPYTVFAGHWHNYYSFTKKERKYFVLATTGGASCLNGPKTGQFDEIVWVTLRKNDKEPIIANLELNGILPWDVRPSIPLEYAPHVQQGVTISAEPVFLSEESLETITTTLHLKNTADLPAKVRLVFTPPKGVRVAPKEQIQNIKAGAVHKCQLQLQLSPDRMKTATRIPYTISVEYQLEGLKPFMKSDRGATGVLPRKFPCPPVTSRITIDGKLNDWPDLSYNVSKPTQVLHNPKTHHGPKDGRFRFGVAYDNDYLYVAVEAFDDVVSPPSMNPWHQDGVEVRINANPLGKQGGAQDWKDLLPIAVAPARKGKKMQIWLQKNLPTGTKVVSVRTPTGHVTEIAVPVSYLESKQGKDWKSFRLNVAVDDFDADGGAQLWWKSDWRTGDNLPGSGTFERK